MGMASTGTSVFNLFIFFRWGSEMQHFGAKQKKWLARRPALLAAQLLAERVGADCEYTVSVVVTII